MPSPISSIVLNYRGSPCSHFINNPIFFSVYFPRPFVSDPAPWLYFLRRGFFLSALTFCRFFPQDLFSFCPFRPGFFTSWPSFLARSILVFSSVDNPGPGGPLGRLINFDRPPDWLMVSGPGKVADLIAKRSLPGRNA